MSLFNSREINSLILENKELQEQTIRLARAKNELEVKLFNAYGWEMMEKLTSELELTPFQRSKLGLVFFIERARLVGVPEDKILHNIEEIEAFFTEGES